MTPEKLLLKRVTREMVRGVGGVEAAAGFCRVGKSVLSDAQNDNRSDCFVALDVVADLEPLARERSGWPHVTQALCQIMGGTFVALPETTASGADMLRLLAQQSQAKAALTASLCEALGDGVVDRNEGARLLRLVDEAIAVDAAMRAELKKIVEGQ